MKKILQIIEAIFNWVMSHKKIVFLYVPSAITIIIIVYVLIIYISWNSDRDDAMRKLAKYKQLIDRTEELRKGYVYQYSQVDLKAKVVDIPTRIYDRNDEIIGEFFEQKREIVPYDFIPQWLVKSVIASEDRDFYNHRGISYKGIMRAFFKNIISFRVAQGGSTVTQQLAKVLFTNMERSLKRKIYEAFCAREIEKLYDKQDILSMYLNLIYFGNGAYGVESTAKMYFGKSVRGLSVVECAMIVATISNPRLYSPIFNLNNSVKKTERILQSLVDAKYLKSSQKDSKYKSFLRKWDVVFDEKGKATTSLVGSFVYSSYRINRAPFFNERIRRILVNKFGEDVVKKGGLRVYTTIDGAKQDIALKSLRAGIMQQREYHLKLAGRIKNKNRAMEEMVKADNIEGGLVSLDPGTGEILAYVGGSEFSSRNQNDHVSQIIRQPGSSFKPIVYAAAIEDRDITPSTVFVDERTKFKGGYRPRNYDNTYKGNIIVRNALSRSVNVVAVKVLDKTGYSRIFKILKNSLNLSGSEMRKRFGKTLSLALGTYEISPLENCVLHSVLVNGGDYIFPYGIRYVKDYNENIVWNFEEEVNNKVEEERDDLGKIINPAAAAVTISMLKGVFMEGGTAYYAVKNKGINFPIAGKTGTSTNFNDAWFVGYTSSLVTSVWIGNKTGAISLGRGRAGGSVAAPVWANYIASAFRGNPPGKFQVPDEGITREMICLDSGKVARKNGECPNTVEQLYFAGSEPGEYCDIHKEKPENDSKENTGDAH